MTMRDVCLSGALAFTALAAPLAGCSAPDPGLVTFSSPPGRAAGGSGREDGGAMGGGNESGGDAGTDAGGLVMPTAFSGAGGYTTAIPGGDTLNGGHNFVGATPSTNPAGQKCLDCHKLGGSASPFAFGGTVYKEAAGTNPALAVEVRIRDLAGVFMVTHSDAYGNFYAKIDSSGPQPISANSLAGARDNAGNLSTMTGALTGAAAGSCNQGGACHGGTAGKIHVP